MNPTSNNQRQAKRKLLFFFWALPILVLLLAINEAPRFTLYLFKQHRFLKPAIKFLSPLIQSTETLTKNTCPPCVRWMSPFLSSGGYSSEAWSYIASLHEHVADSNLRIAIEQHGDSESLQFWLGLPEESKNLARKLYATECNMNETIVICHSEPGAWHPPMFQTLPCPPTGYDEPLFVIGRTMFETDRLTPEHVRRCNRMKEVWVPTEFHVSTFVDSGVDSSKVVKMIQPVDVVFFDPMKHVSLPLPVKNPVIGDESGSHKSFVFLSVFKWEYRKGWDVLLSSYLEEFSNSDRVALYLLTNAFHSDDNFSAKITEFVRSSSIEEPDGGWAPVYVINSHIAQKELPRLYKAASAFVLPTRGEGWGRPIVEAMSMELPVIVTNWSGPTEYLTDDNGYPLHVDRMVEVTEGPFKGHLCAEPSKNHLRALMRHVVENPEQAKMKGKRAREDMIRRFSPEVVAKLVADQIMKIYSSRNGSLLD